MKNRNNKQNTSLISNSIKIRPLKGKKYKSLQNKTNRNDFFYLQNRSNSNQKINHSNNQNQQDTSSFEIQRQSIHKINQFNKNNYQIKWKVQKLSPIQSKFKKPQQELYNFGPVIQRSNKIPDNFFQPINQIRKPLQGLNNEIPTKRIQNSLDKQRYLPKLKVIIQYKENKNDKSLFKFSKQQIDKLRQFFPEKRIMNPQNMIESIPRKFL